LEESKQDTTQSELRQRVSLWSIQRHDATEPPQVSSCRRPVPPQNPVDRKSADVTALGVKSAYPDA